MLCRSPNITNPLPNVRILNGGIRTTALTAELEVLDFLKALVTTRKPELVVEAGTFSGLSTLRIEEGLKANGPSIDFLFCDSETSIREQEVRRFVDGHGSVRGLEKRRGRS